MSRCWCFTVNNPKDKDVVVPDDKMIYMVIGEEVGENGTPHRQGFVILKVRTRLSTMKKWIPRGHLELMRGNSTQAAEYCMKDGIYAEFGTFEFIDKNGNGTRKYQGQQKGGEAKAQKFRDVIALAKKRQFSEIEKDYPAQYWQNYHTMKRIAMDNPPVLSALDKLDNEWIYGLPGVGKSRIARAENPGLYIKLHNKWWIGYAGEEVVLYDDLSRNDANWVGDMLKTWADHYPFPAETKGDGMVIRPKKIIVTSNYTPDDLFSHDYDLCEAIKRRFRLRHLIVPPMFDLPRRPPAPPIIPVFDEPTQVDLTMLEESDDLEESIEITSHQPEYASQTPPHQCFFIPETQQVEDEMSMEL